MRVTIIGSGNVATILGRRILKAKHTIYEVYSRNPDDGGSLAGSLSADYINDVAKIDVSSDLYLISVVDKAVEEIAAALQVGDKLVVHTAGSVSMQVLEQCSTNIGIIYPLQSIRKELNADPFLPILVDANNDLNRKTLFAFAESFADSVEIADDVKRSKLHLAAVISNNFSNYLFTLAEDYCLKEGVEFKSIVPLLEETVKRLHVASPRDVQTGPAVRNDIPTLEKHIKMLEGYPELLELYSEFSARIGRLVSK